MVDWEGVNEFVAVAETTSFTAAAQRLGTSVAQVSRRIGQLENRLNVQLFQRTTRKVTITEEGRVYYNHCRQVLDGLREAERAVTSLQRQPSGKLRITAPVSYGEIYVAPLVNDFLLQNPKLDVDMRLTNQRLDLIDEGLDLAIRLGVLEDARLVAKKLGSRELRLCASPKYLAKYGEPHTPAELSAHSCLLGTLDYWRFKVDGETRTIKVKGRLHCSSGPALRDAALKGLGLVQLPDYYVRNDLNSGKLINVLDTFRPPEEGIWALYSPNRHPSPKVSLLIDFLRRGLTS